MSKRDGGPAFPTGEYVRIGDREHSEAKGGMTLRDYFAGQALASILSSAEVLVAFNGMGAKIGSDNDHDAVARVAYNFADAMLEERGRDS